MARIVATNRTAASNRQAIVQRQNLILRSETFDNATWTKTGISVSPDIIAAPNGALTADGLLATSTSSGLKNIVQSEPVITRGQFQTFSVYAKAGATSWISLIAEGTFADYNFGLSGVGSIGLTTNQNTTPVIPSIVSVGNGWYRCSLTCIRAHASVTVRVYALSSNSLTQNWAASDTVTPLIYLWGAQIEQRDQAGVYTPTVGSAVNTGTPRNIVTQSQNLITYSEQFNNAAWSKDASGLTVTDNVAVSPNGNTTASLYQASAGTNYKYNRQAFTSASSTYTGSAYVKAGTYNYVGLRVGGALQLTAYFNLTTQTITNVNGLANGIVPMGNGWFRIWSTAYPGAGSSYLSVTMPSSSGQESWTTAGTENIYVFGAQLVRAASPGPYIQTTASVVNIGSIRNTP